MGFFCDFYKALIRHKPELMGKIRLLLALSVVAAHCGAIWQFNMLGGKDAVEAFFIISGFYMSLILNEKYVGVNKSYKLFITNRMLRLAPIYWVVLFFTVIACLGELIISKGQIVSLFSSYTTVYPNIASFTGLILTNILIFGQDVVMFLGINPTNGNFFLTSNPFNSHPPVYTFLFVPQAWSLGIELTFYLIAPFVVTKGYKPVIIIIVLSFLLRLFIYNHLGLQNDPWTYRFFPTELLFFLLGYVSYRIYLNIKTSVIPEYASLLVFYFLLLYTLCYSFLPAVQIGWFPFSVKQFLYQVTIVLSIPIIFKYFKNNHLDTQIGELSYPVYISHILINLVLTSKYFIAIKTGWCVAIISIAFSWLLIKYVAAPIEKYRQRRLKKPV
jgi:peptidoglycan/LPS O-acetylase OafA/YrhL